MAKEKVAKETGLDPAAEELADREQEQAEELAGELSDDGMAQAAGGSAYRYRHRGNRSDS